MSPAWNYWKASMADRIHRDHHFVRHKKGKLVFSYKTLTTRSHPTRKLHGTQAFSRPLFHLLQPAYLHCSAEMSLWSYVTTNDIKMCMSEESVVPPQYIFCGRLLESPMNTLGHRHCRAEMKSAALLHWYIQT